MLASFAHKLPLFILLSPVQEKGGRSQCIADTLENGMLGSEILHSKGELSEAEKLQSVTETIVIGLFVCETKCNKRRITDGKLVCPP